MAAARLTGLRKHRAWRPNLITDMKPRREVGTQVVWLEGSEVQEIRPVETMQVELSLVLVLFGNYVGRFASLGRRLRACELYHVLCNVGKPSCWLLVTVT